MKYYWKSRELLFGLMVGCPFQEEDDECPLLSVRSGDLRKMKQLAFEDIDEANMDSILSHHRICCDRRDGFFQLH